MKKTSYLVGTPNWVDLGTLDVEKSAAFYGRLFGWGFEPPDQRLGGYVNATKNGVRVAGIMPKRAGSPIFWGTFFASDDVDAAVAVIENAGGTVMVRPEDVGDEGRMLFATDPTGAAFGLWQPKRHKGAGLFGEAGAMVWHELSTSDVKKAVRFYEAVLGVTTNEIEPGYFIIEKGGLGHGGITGFDGDKTGSDPLWQVYFAVDDADVTATAIRDLGGTVVSAPEDSPYGRMGYAKDVVGARFAFMKPTPPTPK